MRDHQLQDHAIVLDNKSAQAQQGRNHPRAANSTNRNNQTPRKGGRNQQGSGNQDPTDPKIWLTKEQYHALSAEQKQTRRAKVQAMRKQKEQRQQQQQGTNVPATITVSTATTATPAATAAVSYTHLTLPTNREV